MTSVDHLVAGRYRIARPLGAGGLGRVWLAIDEAHDRDVAVKKCSIPHGLTDEEQQLVRDWMLREARAAARVRDPHVVRIHDVLAGEDQPWIVMEYVPSRSLQQLIHERGPMPADQVAGIGLAVLRALNAARRVGVRHLDVKPGNVLVAEDGRIMLTDFAPAVTDEGVGALARAGVILGSPNYLAPERLYGGASTPLADLWSLGATLYHAAEGRPPYARASTAATLRALAGDSPDPPRRAGALVPVLNGLLQRDPADRLTPAEIEDRLLRVADRPARGSARAAGSPAATEPPSPPAGSAAAAERDAGSTTDGPETAYARRGRGSARRRTGGRRTALVAVSAVVAALAAVAATQAIPGANGGERGGTGAGGARTALTRPTRPAGNFALPPRFGWWSDRSGFRVAIPTGWRTTRPGPHTVAFTARGGLPSLRISAGTPGQKDVVSALIGAEGEVKLPGYRRIRIEALPTQPDAVWEYTYRDPQAGPLHGLEQVVVRDGNTYTIQWRAPAATWAENLQSLAVVLDSFRPLDGT